MREVGCSQRLKGASCTPYLQISEHKGYANEVRRYTDQSAVTCPRRLQLASGLQAHHCALVRRQPSREAFTADGATSGIRMDERPGNRHSAHFSKKLLDDILRCRNACLECSRAESASRTRGFYSAQRCCSSESASVPSSLRLYALQPPPPSPVVRPARGTWAGSAATPPIQGLRGSVGAPRCDRYGPDIRLWRLRRRLSPPLTPMATTALRASMFSTSGVVATAGDDIQQLLLLCSSSISRSG